MLLLYGYSQKNFPREGLRKAAAVTKDNQGLVIGAATLLVEPKFIFGGGKVGHIEVLSKGRMPEERHWVQAAIMCCVKTVLYCSDENAPFYQKLGYSYQDNCIKIMHK